MESIYINEKIFYSEKNCSQKKRKKKTEKNGRGCFKYNALNNNHMVESIRKYFSMSQLSAVLSPSTITFMINEKTLGKLK